VEIRRPADPAQEAPPVQLCGHGHRIGRLAAAVQIQDCVVDVLMRGPVEVAGTQPLQHVGDGVLAQQHAAQDRHLGRVVLRGLAPEVLTGWRGVHARMAEVIYDRHAASHLPSL
jgi:hypothetical protein